VPKSAKSRMRRTETSKSILTKILHGSRYPQIVVIVGFGVFGWRGVKFPPLQQAFIVALITL